jgi:hypothetical protein
LGGQGGGHFENDLGAEGMNAGVCDIVKTSTMMKKT